MEIKYNVTKLGVYIYLFGELDESSSKRARQQIDDIIDNNTNARTVVFNMRELSFMDSTGIGMLIGRYKKIKQLKMSAFIENPSFCVDKVFSTSGIYSLIPKL